MQRQTTVIRTWERALGGEQQGSEGTVWLDRLKYTHCNADDSD